VEVFMRWFGPENGAMSDNKAARIADGINQACREQTPD
jgi:hypothetical protein